MGNVEQSASSRLVRGHPTEDLGTPAPRTRGGRQSAPALPGDSRHEPERAAPEPRRDRWLTASPWLGPALKGAAALVVVACLAAVGMASSARADSPPSSLQSEDTAFGLGNAPSGARPVEVRSLAPEDAGTAPSGITPDGKVVLNVATSAELTRLPSVGPRRAEAIIALRTKLVRFRRLTQLLRVRGIGRKSLKRIEPLVVLDPPEQGRGQPKDGGAD